MNSYDDGVLTNIQQAALDNSADNRMSVILSDWAAWNIAYRSKELQDEPDRYIINPEEKKKQIDICWKKRFRQRN